LKGFVDDAMDIAGGRDGVMVINGVREETSMDHRGERLWEQGIEIALGKAIRSAVGAARSKVTVEWLDGEEKAFVISFDGKINGANVIRLVVSNSPNMDAFRRKEMGAFFKGMAGQISYERRGEDEARLIASIVAAKGKGGGLKRAMAKAGFLVSKETYGEKPASRHKRVNMAVIVEPPIADIQRVIDDISDSLHYFGYIVIMTDRPSNVRKAVSKHNDGKRKWYEIRLVEDVKDRDGHTMLFRRSGTTFSRRSR
jgi:hypothetical protein